LCRTNFKNWSTLTTRSEVSRAIYRSFQGRACSSVSTLECDRSSSRGFIDDGKQVGCGCQGTGDHGGYVWLFVKGVFFLGDGRRPAKACRRNGQRSLERDAGSQLAVEPSIHGARGGVWPWEKRKSSKICGGKKKKNNEPSPAPVKRGRKIMPSGVLCHLSSLEVAQFLFVFWLKQVVKSKPEGKRFPFRCSSFTTGAVIRQDSF